MTNFDNIGLNKEFEFDSKDGKKRILKIIKFEKAPQLESKYFIIANGIVFDGQKRVYEAELRNYAMLDILTKWLIEECKQDGFRG